MYINFLIFFFLFSVLCWVHINGGDEYEVNGTLAVNAPGDYSIHLNMQFQREYSLRLMKGRLSENS